MITDKNAELLGEVPLFHGLSPEQLSIITAAGEKMHFEAGEHIIKARSKSETGYLILSGTVETRPTKKSGLELESFETGSFVGEMALLTEMIASMTVVAVSRVRALAIQRDALYKLMEGMPDIAFHLSDKVTERLVDLAHDLRELDVQLSAIEVSADTSLAALA